jgi:hypothetical protein
LASERAGVASAAQKSGLSAVSWDVIGEQVLIVLGADILGSCSIFDFFDSVAPDWMAIVRRSSREEMLPCALALLSAFGIQYASQPAT